MTLDDYIQAIKTHLSGVGNDPLPVVDGPLEFAKNSQGIVSQFVCVAETEIPYQRYNTEKVFSSNTGILIQIHVEKGATRDNAHLTRARNAFDAIWRSIGGYTVNGFSLIREGGRRLKIDDASMVEYEISCILEITEYEQCQ
jgi:hypothetical protein